MKAVTKICTTTSIYEPQWTKEILVVIFSYDFLINAAELNHRTNLKIFDKNYKR
jgi:hypothetical protein